MIDYHEGFKWLCRFDEDDVLCKIAELARTHYNSNDGHGWDDHIKRTAIIAEFICNRCNPDLDPMQLAVAVMYHDAALRSHGRADHEIWSAYMVERELKHMLDDEAVENITTAIMDHRNSKKYVRALVYGKAWRNIYSEYLAAADRGVPATDIDKIYERAIKTKLQETDDLNEVTMHAYDHIKRKYGQHDDFLPVPYLVAFRDELDKQREVINTVMIGDVRELVEKINSNWNRNNQKKSEESYA